MWQASVVTLWIILGLIACDVAGLLLWYAAASFGQAIRRVGPEVMCRRVCGVITIIAIWALAFGAFQR